jgi:4-amino-4-deoxy-L-arabinose transferase-like glycosyltransferase
MGLGFGLPHEFHPDEFRVLDIAIGLTKGSLGELRFWNYPPALANICTGVYRAFDMVHAPRAELLLAGRSVVFVLGIVTVLAVAAAAYSASGLRAAILGSALAAVSPLMIEHCRYLTPDTPTAAGTALVALAAAQITRQSSRRGWRYALAGVAVGLAASFKYVGALSAITIIAAHVFSANRRDWRAWVLLLAAGVLSVLTFIALNHQVISTPHWMTAALLDEFRHYTRIGGGYATSFAAPHALLYVVSCGIGWVGAAFLMCTVLSLRSPVVWALVVGAGSWFVFVATRNVFFARNLVHFLPLLFVLIGVVGSELLERITHRHLQFTAAVTTLVALLVLPVLESSRFAMTLANGDTRIDAALWMRDNSPSDARVVASPPTYAPYLPPQTLHRRRVVVPTKLQSVETLISGNYSHIVVSWGHVSRYTRSPREFPKEVEDFDQWYEDLNRSAELLARFEKPGGPGSALFGGTVDIFHNPRIEVFAVRSIPR